MKGDFFRMLMYCRELLTQLEQSFFRYISLRRMQRTKQGGFTLVETYGGSSCYCYFGSYCNASIYVRCR